MLAVSAQPLSRLWCDVLGRFALAHIAIDHGATHSELLRDLSPYAAHRLSPSEFRNEIDAALAQLTRDGFIGETRGRFQATPLGVEQAQTLLGWRALPPNWQDVRDTHLTALALGMSEAPQTRIKLLARPDGLRAAILQQHFGLKLRRTPTLARVRAELAGLALKQAFGNTLPDDLNVKGGVNARSSRLLAAQLSRTPRDFGSDGRLIAVLAAEALGVPQSDVGSLRTAVLRRYISDATIPDGTAQPAPAPTLGQAPLQARPDLAQFVAAVHAAAARCANGLSASRKALIGDVWDIVRDEHPGWAISEVEFKSMLCEAHRTGHLSLANADLKSKDQAADFQRSAVNFKNTVWHFVRLPRTQHNEPAGAVAASGNIIT